MSKIFFPQYKKGKEGLKIKKGSTILDCIHKLGIEISSECGGRGECGKCIVRIEKGNSSLSNKTQAEGNFSLGEDERLACQAEIVDDRKDIYVFIKDFGRYKILIESEEKKVELDPFVRKSNSNVLYGEERIDSYKGKIYGLAIDVGTTTLVFDVVDLETGQTVATVARKNPQISYGNDVISRIEYTMVDKEAIKYVTQQERGRRLMELQKAVVEGINENLRKFEEERSEKFSQYIYDVTMVGNPTMRNIFFGVDVSSLGLKPYEPIHKDSIVKKAVEIGLDINPQARIYGAPLIGGHAGADALADILATDMHKSDKVVMAIDIGTNGEVMMGNRDKIMTCSCAAGGAYEGATIKCGTGAIEGAIKTIRIKNGKVEYETIGDKPPVGICGSGLIDILGELLNNNIMTPKAKLEKEFFVTDGISITQEDIYQLITAKAGLRIDQDLLVKYYGVSLDEVDKIYLAGAFGSYINTDNAIRMGLLPEAKGKIVKIGNGALEGAREMLISRRRRDEIEKVAKTIEHIKPNEREPDFAYLVAGKMYFEEILH